MQDPDAIVIGSGPNGLVAAATLGRAGLRVLVLEANPHRFGGAVGTTALTLPGFQHDVGAGFFTFGTVSPAFQALNLRVNWAWAEVDSAHPGKDGSEAGIACSPRGPIMGPDTHRYLALQQWYRSVQPDVLGALLNPIPAVSPLARLGPGNLARLGQAFATTGRRVSQSWFQSEAAQRVLPALALHVDAGPDDAFGAGIGVMLTLQAAATGFPVPVGGAQTVTDALVEDVRNHGGTLELGATVDHILVRKGRAEGVVLSDGTKIAASMIQADVSAPALYLKLLQGKHGLVRRMKRFRQGFATLKIDWALSGPVPWNSDMARRAAVVHTGESIDDLARFTRQVRLGELPDDPYLVIGQQSLVDPSRAPEGQHTLWAYTRVPALPSWDGVSERYANVIDDRIEGLAPGFKEHILARTITTPQDLEADNANLREGDLGGGSNAWHRQLVFRPAFPWFRYKTPVKGLYLCSSYAHPGAGVHGMCGFNAARVALGQV